MKRSVVSPVLVAFFSVVAGGWLLQEGKQRSSHQFRLAACDTRLMAVMPRLEAVGDAVWFQGELYRQKMHGDVQAMLSRVTEQVHARRQMEDELRKSPETKRAVIQKEQVVAAKTEMRIAPRGLPAGQWGRTAPMTPVRGRMCVIPRRVSRLILAGNPPPR